MINTPIRVISNFSRGLWRARNLTLALQPTSCYLFIYLPFFFPVIRLCHICIAHKLFGSFVVMRFLKRLDGVKPTLHFLIASSHNLCFVSPVFSLQLTVLSLLTNKFILFAFCGKYFIVGLPQMILKYEIIHMF